MLVKVWMKFQLPCSTKLITKSSILSVIFRTDIAVQIGLLANNLPCLPFDWRVDECQVNCFCHVVLIFRSPFLRLVKITILVERKMTSTLRRKMLLGKLQSLLTHCPYYGTS